jgi:outer membrane biosynthesis protein TonB
MARITQHLTSISAQLPRSGPPPGRRLLAAVLCALLVLASIAPGFALAGEADSEGEGTNSPIEVPVSPPDFDPGGEEAGLEEEVPASVDEEETGAEVEVEAEAQLPEEVNSAAIEPPVEEAPPPAPTASTEPETSAPAAEAVQQKEAEPSEPVANQEIVGPRRESAAGSTASPGAIPATAPPAAPTRQEAPTSPQPVASSPADPGRNLGGKSSYVVRPGDCLWHIAAAVLPAGSDTQAIGDKVKELWRMNEDRIGTGDPNLIYPGTELRLR